MATLHHKLEFMSVILVEVPIYHYKVECTMLTSQTDMEWCCVINRLLHICRVSCHRTDTPDRKRDIFDLIQNI
jgi:hypothetical protein